MPTFIYDFEELPLVTVGEVEACLINGEAEIEYDRNGLWEVLDITVNGYQGHTLSRQVTAPEIIRSMITERLYGLWHDRVQAAVREQLELDREMAEEERADMIRERRHEVE